jgi:DNA-binding transcriptional LysR family regulator
MKGQRTPRLSLDLMRGFRAAARHLSFTRAARELSVTQSAVSHEVRKLEEQLGTPLFTRASRTLGLTEAGERLYRAADEAISLIDAAAADVAGAGRSLTITTTVPLASLWLTPRLPEFLRLHPGIGLRVVASNDNLDLARERIDLAIRYAPQRASPPSPTKLFDFEVFPVCSPALALSADRPIRSIEDLARHVHLEFETARGGGRSWHDWDQWLAAKQIRGLKSAGTLRFSHYDQVVAAAIAGSGVAIGKWPYLEHQLQQGALVAPLGSAGAATIGGFYLVTPEAPTSATASFVAWLRAQAQRDVENRERWKRRKGAPAAIRPRARRR